MELIGLRVLVVEDEALISMLVEDYLDELGCEVVATAARLEDALEKARVLPIDAAVLDVNLAGQLSYPAAEALHSRAVPFVFTTGYGTGELPVDLCAAPVLPKPFGRDQLAMALQAATGG